MDVDSAIVQAARKLGYGDVKSEQSRVIREIVAGNDVFVALPTGYGNERKQCVQQCHPDGCSARLFHVSFSALLCGLPSVSPSNCF